MNRSRDAVNKEVSFLLSRFPTHRRQIVDEYQENEEFRTLCDDFYSCSEMLEDRHIKLMAGLKDELECRHLFLELEQELINILGSLKTRRAASPVAEPR